MNWELIKKKKNATYIVIGDQGIHVVLLGYEKCRVNIWSDKNAV